MPITWFEPIFPYNLIYDLGSYSIFSFIFLLLYKMKIIEKRLLFLSLFFLLTPFLFNGLMFDWSFMPDQSKYLFNAYNIREDFGLIFNPTAGQVDSVVVTKVHLPAVFFALSPVLTLETYKGIALLNRTIFLLSWIFFVKKKFLDEYSAVFFLLAPSLVFYSSLALRDILVVLLMFWFIYFYYQKKNIINLIICIILYFIKYQMLITISLFIILDKIIKNDKVNFKLLFIVALSSAIIIHFINEELLIALNHVRQGFFLEEFGRYTSISALKNYQYLELDWSISSLTKVAVSFYNFIIPPALNGKYSVFSYMHLLEVIAICAFLFLKIKEQINFKKNILAKWLLVLLFSYLVNSIVIFNAGSSTRYKIPIIFFIIFGYCTNVRLDRNK